ncbi:uncharacterized protein LOC129728914 [Wyeomyia smithii]|uniref:uncharacterized protein LOC129728914 n=1 Tax=Wyeomyia smithii TaxID=174621 RepID=UPI002467B17C|nr:uncharacterized protein LOC129728914 [Wyeomyia smithii]
MSINRRQRVSFRSKASIMSLFLWNAIVVTCFSLHIFASCYAYNESNFRGADHGRSLLFPSSSTIQLSICTSSGGPLFTPKKVYPYRRLGVNLGFQVNYALPYRLKDFYSYPTWARAMVDIVKGRVLPTEVVTARAARKRRSNRHLSAGDIYQALTEALQISGYDEDCLVKSVCELAHSPFHNTEDDLYAEILQFVLSPSEHKSFEPHERVMRVKYETAERLGRAGADCHFLYPKCRNSFLNDISNYVEEG